MEFLLLDAMAEYEEINVLSICGYCPLWQLARHWKNVEKGKAFTVSCQLYSLKQQHFIFQKKISVHFDDLKLLKIAKKC